MSKKSTRKQKLQARRLSQKRRRRAAAADFISAQAQKGGRMLPDFSDAYADVIMSDGTLDPPMLNVMMDIRWLIQEDPDGLLYSGVLPDPDGNQCMISILFPTLTLKSELPMRSSDTFVITQMLDKVNGNSGERYGRFLVFVVKYDDHSNVSEMSGWRKNKDGTLSYVVGSPWDTQ